MADPGSVSDLLADLLEGRSVAASVGGEAAALAMLARRCERLAVPGPSPASEVHIRTRVIAMLEGERGGRPWLGGWLGGTAVRPLRERLAAGALLFAIAGGGASVATGVSPVEFASGVGEFARSVVVNLTPGDGTGQNAVPTPQASPSQTAPAAGQSTPDAASTPSPSSTPAASNSTIAPAASSTPEPTQVSGASPTTQPAMTATPTLPANTVTQSPTQSSTPQTATPPGSSATPDEPDDSDNRTRTPEPGDDNGGGSSGSGSSGSGSSGSGSDD